MANRSQVTQSRSGQTARTGLPGGGEHRPRYPLKTLRCARRALPSPTPRNPRAANPARADQPGQAAHTPRPGATHWPYKPRSRSRRDGERPATQAPVPAYPPSAAPPRRGWAQRYVSLVPCWRKAGCRVGASHGASRLPVRRQTPRTRSNSARVSRTEAPAAALYQIPRDVVPRRYGIHGIVAVPAAHGTTPANTLSEAVMRTGSVLPVIWLVIGAIAGGQRHYYSSSDPNCGQTGTIIVTVLAARSTTPA